MYLANKLKVQCSKYQMAQASCTYLIVFISSFHHSGSKN